MVLIDKEGKSPLGQRLLLKRRRKPLAFPESKWRGPVGLAQDCPLIFADSGTFQKKENPIGLSD
jgi:hypothetical protein